MKQQYSSHSRPSWLQHLMALVVCTMLLFSTVAAAPLAVQPQDIPPTQTAPAASTVAASPVDPGRVNFHQIVFQLKASDQIRISAEGVSSASGVDTAALADTLKDVAVRPLFSHLDAPPEEAGAADMSQAMPTLSQYYLVEMPEEATFEMALAKLQVLQGNPSVHLAYMEPIYSPAAVPDTDDFTALQLYLNPSPQGIDALYSQGISGGTGLNIRVIDIEQGWTLGHEDLNISSSSLIDSSNSQEPDWVEHGTAVLGTIAALKNNYGVTGVAPDAELKMVSDLNRPLADAINLAATKARTGDILVIPLQALGPYSGLTCTCSEEECARFESIPVEYWQANYDAIYAATQAGVIVVEAAGNGGMNLRDDRYNGLFKRATRDSGAILVGAGDNTVNHAPLCSANYGNRIDLQGWGQGIVTTGYGDLPYKAGEPPFGTDHNRYYTALFGGSSGATAMVAGAAASLQGVAKKRGFMLSPGDLRSVLKSTGSAQATSTDRPIGPLPNLRRAIEENLPNVVLLISPTNGSTLSTRRPLLDWGEYYGASTYHLQIATSSTFEDLILDEQISGTEYQLTDDLGNNATYYWKVCATLEDGSEKGCSSIWSFSIVARSVASPSLVSPKNEAVTANFRPEFKWKAPAIKSSAANYPEGYQLQVSTRYDFATQVINVHQTGLTYTPTVDLSNNSLYYWRVRGYQDYDPVKQVASSYSAWTSRRILYTAPLPATLMLPADAAVVDVLRPQLGWQDSTQAKKYQVQISQNSGFSQVVYNAIITRPSGDEASPFLHVVQSTLPRSKTLYWRVRLLGTYGWSAWSAARTFQTGTPPGVPTLKSPSNKGVVNKIPDEVVLSWNKASGVATGYEVQIARDSDFEDIFDDGFVIAPEVSYTPSGLEQEKIYYWRVRSYNDSTGNTFNSGWSAVRLFYTTPLPPASLVDPVVDSLTVTLDWEKVDVARAYQLQLARSDTFVKSSIIATVSTLKPPPFTVPVVLPRSVTIYWRVSTKGLYGYSRYSVSGSFTTPDAPNPPELLTPVSGAVLTGFTPTLDWSTVAKDSAHPDRDPVGYHVQVSSSSSFPVDPAKTIIDEQTTDTASKYVIPQGAILIAGQYYWRVRTIGAGGAYSTWAGPFTFYTPSILNGTVTDYLSADPADSTDMGPGLASALVQIDGTALSTVTDSNGFYEFRGIPAGSYVLVISKNGFIRQTRSITVDKASNTVLDFPLVQIPADGQIRIVLTWAKAPADLDLHLWLPKMTPFHLYKNNPGDLAGDEHAALFRNDANGYGPEVITIDQLNAGVYTLAVLQPATNTSGTLNTSQAVVTIYDGIKQKRVYFVPTSGTGPWWYLCTFDGTSRTFTNINVLRSTTPAPY